LAVADLLLTTAHDDVRVIADGDVMQYRQQIIVAVESWWGK
jgi:hypothetical protein